MNDEQWKNKGICDLCRKKSYCGNECKAHKQRVKLETFKIISKAMDNVTGGAFSLIFNNKGD